MNETGIMKDVLNQSSSPIISFNESSTNEHLKKDSTSDEALTAIVISQRERFRVRNVELENVYRCKLCFCFDKVFICRKMFH